MNRPEAFAHEQRYIAYHEAGHALMNMLFYGDLKQVSIPFGKDSNGFRGKAFCTGIYHDWIRSDDERARRRIEQAAILSAGKAAADLFCTCGNCTKAAHQADSDKDGDEERFTALNIADEHKRTLLSATFAAIQRHRPQLDAIANALIERETLSGDEVEDVMLASGWNPDTDADPAQFYNEAALGIKLRSRMRVNGC